MTMCGFPISHPKLAPKLKSVDVTMKSCAHFKLYSYKEILSKLPSCFADECQCS
jgi:hypothetical protein